MSLEPWDELRTALHVARAGTVSGAAQALGVHHATVIRHVDALEDRLGVKLFQRHAKGYSPTEAGRVLADSAAQAEARFDHLAARLKALQGEIEGELIISTVPELCDPILPALAHLRASHPALQPCLRIEERLARLEYGEAHLAIRAGARPQEPDNVVQALGVLPFALFAADSYVARRGLPADGGALSGHDAVGVEAGHARAPFDRWLAAQDVTFALRCNDRATLMAALRAGLGLGFAHAALTEPGLQRALAPRTEWQAPVWLVTHVDLHRSPKVQTAAAALKARLADAMA